MAGSLLSFRSDRWLRRLQGAGDFWKSTAPWSARSADKFPLALSVCAVLRIAEVFGTRSAAEVFGARSACGEGINAASSPRKVLSTDAGRPPPRKSEVTPSVERKAADFWKRQTTRKRIECSSIEWPDVNAARNATKRQTQKRSPRAPPSIHVPRLLPLWRGKTWNLQNPHFPSSHT